MLTKEQLFNIQQLVMTADEIRGPNGTLTLPKCNEFRQKFYSNTVREMRKYHARGEQIDLLTDQQKGVSLDGEVVLDNPRPTGDGKNNAKSPKHITEAEKLGNKIKAGG